MFCGSQTETAGCVAKQHYISTWRPPSRPLWGWLGQGPTSRNQNHSHGQQQAKELMLGERRRSKTTGVPYFCDYCAGPSAGTPTASPALRLRDAPQRSSRRPSCVDPVSAGMVESGPFCQVAKHKAIHLSVCLLSAACLPESVYLLLYLSIHPSFHL